MNREEKLIYINEKGQQIEFSVWSSFFVVNLEGINGLSNIIYTSKGVKQDGESIISDNLDIKNIVIEGTIKDNKDVNRYKLIKALNPKTTGELIYENGLNKRKITCKVDKIPSVTNDKKPKFLISFYCANPFWQEIKENKQDIALWKGSFHFPLRIPKIKGTIMGFKEPSLIVNVENKGDVSCPMKVEFLAKGTVINPSIFNVNTREFIKVNKTLVAGEKITIDTDFENLSVMSYLNNVETNAFNFIDVDSEFMELEVGDNLFRYNADSGLDRLEVSIYYTPKFLGV